MLRADGTEMSASPGAESCMQDEGGYVFLRLAIFVDFAALDAFTDEVIEKLFA